MAGALSGATTNLSNLAIGEIGSNATQFGQLDLRTFGAVLSMKTYASASGMTAGNLRLVYQASGLSIVYSSGRSTYNIGSGESAVQP